MSIMKIKMIFTRFVSEDFRLKVYMKSLNTMITLIKTWNYFKDVYSNIYKVCIFCSIINPSNNIETKNV